MYLGFANGDTCLLTIQILNQLKSLFHRDKSAEAAVLNAKKNRRHDVIPCKLLFISILLL
jgi:hypothetical protein